MEILEQAKELSKGLLEGELEEKISGIVLLKKPKEDEITKKVFEELVSEEIRNKFPESYEKNLVIVLVNDHDIEDINKKIEIKAKVEGKAIQTVKEKQYNLWIITLLETELLQNLLESRFELADIIASGQKIYDKGIIDVFRVTTLHRNMVVQKFERYVVCYVLAGSVIRKQATAKSDIDVYIVIDDTDVKRHTQWELQQKLLAIISGMAMEAMAMTGIQRMLHPQVYTLTNFWKSIREVNPVIITFLRDGIPIYDRGLFIPWKLLLQRGEIKPSPEAVEAYLKVGDEFIAKVKGDIKRAIIEDLYYAMLTPAQAAVMEAGLLPPAPKEAPKLLREIFVLKEKLLEEEYVKMLEEIIKIRKDVEHGVFQGNLTGKDLDEWLNRAEKFVNRMQRLVTQLRTKNEEKEVKRLIKDVELMIFDVLRSIGYEVSRENLLEVLEDAISKGYLPTSIKEKYLSLMSEKNPSLAKNILIELYNEVSRYLDKYLSEKIIRKRVVLLMGDKYGELYPFREYILVRSDKGLLKIEIDERGNPKSISEISREEYDKLLRSGNPVFQIPLTQKTLEMLKEKIGEFEILI